MRLIKVTTKGTINKYITRQKYKHKAKYREVLEKYGQRGVEALMEATPKRTGKTAASWYYEIEETAKGFKLSWKNSNVNKEWAYIAYLIQYGFTTSTGGFVEGRDYINPALAPIYEALANDIYVGVTKPDEHKN